MCPYFGYSTIGRCWIHASSVPRKIYDEGGYAYLCCKRRGGPLWLTRLSGLHNGFSGAVGLNLEMSTVFIVATAYS